MIQVTGQPVPMPTAGARNAAAAQGASAAPDQPGSGKPPAPGQETYNERSRVQAAQKGDPSARPRDGEAARKGETAEQAKNGGKRSNEDGLTEKEKKRVAELEREDRQTRQHERAHANAGGAIAGSPQYEFKTGPDGEKYAVSGSVRLDTSKVKGDPEATEDKMQQVVRAALAPARPSAQDRAVAAMARAKMMEAQAEASEKTANETSEAGETPAREPVERGGKADETSDRMPVDPGETADGPDRADKNAVEQALRRETARNAPENVDPEPSLVSVA